MEDTQTLLMMVLKQHFRQRSEILDEALHVIKEYSGKDLLQSEYEKTLDTLRSKMSDLPEGILLYFLSMVPLPKQSDSGFIEELKNSCDQTANSSIRSTLVEYLNAKTPSTVVKNEKSTPVSNDGRSSPKKLPRIRKIAQVKRRRGKWATRDCKSLLDICAENVVRNQAALGQYYRRKGERAWRLVDENRCDKEELRAVIRDVGKKTRLMRMIDCDEITCEVIDEEYGDSGDVFLKRSDLYDCVYDDPFVLSDELKGAIERFVYGD